MSFRRVDFPKVGILCQLFLVGDKIKRTIGFFYVTIVTAASILPTIQSVVHCRRTNAVRNDNTSNNLKL